MLRWFNLAITLALIGFGIKNAVNGDYVWMAINFGIVLACLPFDWSQWFPKKAPLPEPVVSLVKQAGDKPDPQWLAKHQAEHPNCTLCKQMGWK